MVLALVTAFVDLGDWLFQVLIILGVLAGIFHQKIKEELVTLGVVYLALSVSPDSMNRLILVGPIISDIVAAWVRFLGPVVLTVFTLWGGAFLVVNANDQESIKLASNSMTF